jgi:hypothetical protein
MNKRAKKRIKEALEKKNLEQAKLHKEQALSSSKGFKEQRGFTARPDKKKG